MIRIAANHHQGEPTAVRVDRFPDRCPLCHNGIQAKYLDVAHVTDDGIRSKLELVFQCPLAKCQALFISRYSYILHTAECYELPRFPTDGTLSG